MRDYSKIIYLPHHISATRQRMSPHGRAAQFAPFAALTGYGDAIREVSDSDDCGQENSASDDSFWWLELQEEQN